MLATPDVLESILHGPSLRTSGDGNPSSPLRILLHDLLTFFAHTYASVFGITAGPPLHDPIAVAVILDLLGIEPLGFSFTATTAEGAHMVGNFVEEEEMKGAGQGEERWVVEVVTDGMHSTDPKKRGQVGRTVVTAAEPGEGRVRIPRGLDVERFWRVVGECVERAEEAARRSGVFDGISG